MKLTATVHLKGSFNDQVISEATEMVADEAGLSVLHGDKAVAVFAPGEWTFAYLKEQAE